MKIYVLDASVASRFLLVEDLSDKAASVLEDFLGEALDLKAPSLVVYEVGNTLWKAVRQGFISSDEAVQKFSYFLRLRIDTVELDEGEYREVLEWSVRNDVTYYDSVYVKASRKVGATLLTADDILCTKTYKEITTLHLRDYGK